MNFERLTGLNPQILQLATRGLPCAWGPGGGRERGQPPLQASACPEGLLLITPDCRHRTDVTQEFQLHNLIHPATANW